MTEKVTRYTVSALSDPSGRVELRCAERFTLERFIVVSQPPITWHDRLLQRMPRWAQRLSKYWPPRAGYLRRLARTILEDAESTKVTSILVGGAELLAGSFPVQIFWAQSFGVRWPPLEWGGPDRIVLQFEGHFLPVRVTVLSKRSLEP